MPSALDAIAHTILPNVMKLKGASTVVSAMERRDTSIFSNVWEQTGIAHAPQVLCKERNETWRIGVMSMPQPTEMGEAWMVAFVAKKNDAAITHYFTLEYDYVLATKSTRTILTQRDGTKFTKRGEGPPITGDFQTDASAFVEAIMAIISPISTKKD